jgi:hypothetical protein
MPMDATPGSAGPTVDRLPVNPGGQLPEHADRRLAEIEGPW